jgi:hypothetical protein
MTASIRLARELRLVGSASKAGPLVRLIYASRAAIPRGPGHFRSEISDIMAACERHNARAGITGVLVYDRGRFVQMLEGPEAAVDSIYARICQDTRHTDITVLLKEPAGKRLFRDWAMAFANAGDAPLPANASAGWAEMGRKALLERLTDIHDHHAVMSLQPARQER